MNENKITKYCPNCGKLSDFGENQLYCDFLDCQPKPEEMKRLIRVYLEEEHNDLIKRAQQELIKKIEDRFDKLNGEKGDLCLFCGAKKYNSKQGIVHKKDCIVIWLRSQIKTEVKK